MIGAGVIGCSIAYELATHGCSVHVIDARRPGLGATQASAGVLAPYIEGHDSAALRQLGRRSLDLFDEWIGRLANDCGERVPYARSGTLEVARDADEACRLQHSKETLAVEGVAAEWLTPPALSALEPLVTTSAWGGLVISAHGFVGAARLTDCLARAATLQGATFDHEVKATSIAAARNGRVTVRTDRGPLEADRVVLSAGSWSGRVEVEALARPLPIEPVRGQLLQLIPSGPRLGRVIWGSQCYIVPWADGSVLVGATVEHVGFDERATVGGVRDLLDAACALVPSLAGAVFSQVRAGLRPATPDGLPIVGASRVIPGLIYATGHFRNGVLLAPLTAELVRQIVFGSAHDRAMALLSPQRSEGADLC